jgi:hypothetical protein
VSVHFNSPGFYCKKVMWSTLVIMSGFITEFRLLHFTITVCNGPYSIQTTLVYYYTMVPVLKILYAHAHHVLEFVKINTGICNKL